MRFFSTVILTALLAISGASFVRAIAVSPATIDLKGERGETLQGSVTLINTDDREKTHYLSVVKFEGRDEGAAPRFVPEDKEGFPRWISLPSSRVIVPANSKIEVPFQVSIPADVPSGSHFAALMISDAPHDIVATNGASIQANVAILLFLTVDGEAITKTALLDFKISSASTLDVPAGLYQIRLQNQGNVYLVPNGTITLRDVLGRVISQTAVNAEASRLLPGTTRTFEGSFGKAGDGSFFGTIAAQARQFAVGPVSVSLDVAAGEVHTGKLEFFVSPWQLLLVVFSAVAILLLLLKTVANRKRVV